jgi:cation transport regulator ChaC
VPRRHQSGVGAQVERGRGSEAGASERQWGRSQLVAERRFRDLRERLSKNSSDRAPKSQAKIDSPNLTLTRPAPPSMPALPLSVGGLPCLQTVEPLHVFAFGSLLHTHRKLGHFGEATRCCVKGHRRAFNLASTTKRGSLEALGRVVNLCRGPATAETWGVALRCPPPGPERDLVLRFLWEGQEEEYNDPLLLPLFLEDGRRDDHWPAVPFVAVPSVDTPFVESALVLVRSEQSANWVDDETLKLSGVCLLSGRWTAGCFPAAT